MTESATITSPVRPPAATRRAAMPADDRYRVLLREADPTATAAQFATLQTAAGLVYRGRPICATVQPRFLAAAEHRDFLAAAEIGTRLINRADAHFRADYALRHRVLASHSHGALLETHDRSLPDPCGRFDALFDKAGRSWFIEYNAGLCGGLFFAEGLAEAFRDLPSIQALARERVLRFDPTSDAYVEALVTAYARDFGRPLQRLMFLLPDGAAGDLHADHAEIRMMGEAMAGRGIDARRVRAGEAGFDGFAIGEGDWIADAVIVVDWLALSRQPAAAPLFVPRTTEGSWIVNSLGAAVYRSGKHLFALISDPAIDLGETAPERAWIADHVPWTRIVEAGETTDEIGATVDLISHLRAAREQMVLKPSFAMGGLGVVLGWTCSPAEWTRAIEAALAEPYVAQRRIDSRDALLACPSDGGVIDRPLNSDLCCYVWHEQEAYGLHCRVSDTGMTNISGGGGSVVPVFVTD